MCRAAMPSADLGEHRLTGGDDVERRVQLAFASDRLALTVGTPAHRVDQPIDFILVQAVDERARRWADRDCLEHLALQQCQRGGL